MGLFFIRVRVFFDLFICSFVIVEEKRVVSRIIIFFWKWGLF